MGYYGVEFQTPGGKLQRICVLHDEAAAESWAADLQEEGCTIVRIFIDI